MAKLNPILHQELRLSIVSFLVGIESADFKKLIEVTGSTKGNLSVQLTKLKNVGYIKIEKTFKNNYPHTECIITEKGRTEFANYLIDIKKLLNLS